MARFRRQRGKQLGGAPPRRNRRGVPRTALPRETPPVASTAVVAIALFVVGLVGGYTWALDRELRGGILEQRAEAMARPDWVALDALPAHVPRAFLAVVEPELIAGGEMLPNADGPALARELVRQVHLLPTSVGGISRQRLMAPVLEQRLTARELLELYLNRIYLGEAQGYPVYGIHHASREYFEKQPEELTLGEAATLASLLLEPRLVEPSTRVGAVGARRNEVLRVMRLGNLITEDAYRAAIDEPLAFQPGLAQMPMSRPLDWAAPAEPIRLPPAWRPSPPDSTAEGPNRS